MGSTKFKFNGGDVSILCSNCDKILKTSKDFSEQDWSALEGKGKVKSVYCENCKDTVIDLDDIIENAKDNSKSALKDIIPILSEDPEFRENLMRIVAEKMFDDLNNKKISNR